MVEQAHRQPWRDRSHASADPGRQARAAAVTVSVGGREREQVVGSRTFRIVEVASGAVLAEGVDMRVAVDVLSRIDSIFDVSVAVWDPTILGWRALTPGEQRALWNVRRR